MAKRTDKTTSSAQITTDTPATAADTGRWGWLHSFKVQALVVAVLAFCAYLNTFSNQYALDDLIVIVKNEYVYEGLAGLPGIFTKDAFDSYCRQSNSTNLLSGGRYRPLSIATFAAEQQALGPVPVSETDSVLLHAREKGPQEDRLLHAMQVRHIFNVLWYTLSVVVLLYFLRYVVLRNNHIIAFIATLLFALHPLHTEVVANVKSRDEILSLLFICLTFICAFKYREHKKMWWLGAALLSYLLAFLSKEYAITLLVLLPVSFYLFAGDNLQKSIMATLPYVAVAAIYILIRFQAVGSMSESDTADNDIWNNPYAWATASQKPATEIATTLNYLKLLLWPVHLSSDYSYNDIPYKTFAHPLVWLSLLVHMALVAGLVYLLRRRHVLAFAIAFYLLNLLLVCNLIYDIGGTMGERLIYHSSAGLCIAIAWLLYKGTGLVRPQASGRAALAAVVSCIAIAYSCKTIARNPDWKNDLTLFSADIKEAPNSLLINANLGAAVLDRADQAKDSTARRAMLLQGIHLLDKAIALDSQCIPAQLNRALGYFRLKRPDEARDSYEAVVRMMPGYTQLPELYYNVGVLFYFDKRYKDAIGVWQTVLRLKPTYEAAQQNINIAMHDMEEETSPRPAPKERGM